MTVTPAPARPASLMFAAAFVAALVAVLLLGAVTGLFQSRGQPLAALAAAERACATHPYVSERQRCIAARLAETQRDQVARR